MPETTPPPASIRTSMAPSRRLRPRLRWAVFAWLASVLALGCAGGEDAEPEDAAAGDVSGDAAGSGNDVIIVVPDSTGADVPVDGGGAGPGCVPSCAGKQCGSDGCAGSCGNCAIGTQCSPEGLCLAPPGDTPFGAFCGVSEACAPMVPDEDGGMSPSPMWPACLNAQCSTGLCQPPVCTRSCQFLADATNNATGAPTPDGVEDPGHDSCGDAVDGPRGASFRCVNFAPPNLAPVPRCVAGTTFATCASAGDCAEGETCDLIAIFGVSQARCVGAVKEGLPVGAPCSGELAGAPDEHCRAPSLCEVSGCVGICAGHDACLTAQARCEGGACAGRPEVGCDEDWECSAWECEPAQGLEEGDVRGCVPRRCERSADCVDGGFRCAPRLGTGPGSSPQWAHECIAPPPAANAALGDACANDPADASLCEVADLCYKGRCSELCATDADCNEQAQQVCAVAEVAVDTTGTGAVAGTLALSLCESMAHAGALTTCDQDADCEEPGEVCVPIQLPNPAGSLWPYRLERTCRAMPESFGGYGDGCGTVPGSGECKIGFCTIDDVDGLAAPMCSQSCFSAEHCPDVQIGDVTHPSVCRSVRYGQAGTAFPQDDLFAPLCWPAPVGSSRQGCADSYECPTGEVCTAWPLATDPLVPGKVEYVCLAAPPGGAPLGAPCEGNADCASLRCLPDRGGAGYCGALCDPASGDLDCVQGGPFMVCDPHIAIDRTPSTLDLVVPECRKAQSCVPCERHADCTQGMRCVRLAGQRVCSWSCASDAECASKDGGPVCVPSTDAEQPPQTLPTCRPLSCPAQ